MGYRIKKQKNCLGAYVMYDTGRNPQRAAARDCGDFVEFAAVLPRAYFFTKVMVEGFGGAYLFADNKERGYEPSDTPIDFWREGCESRLNRVERYAERLRAKYGHAPREAEKRLDEARRLLGTGCDADVERALCEVLWAGEAMVLFEAESDIAKRGLRDSFAFGCCTKGFTDGGDRWREYMHGPFGHAVIPFHWGVLEPNPGEKHYDVIYEMVDWCVEQGIPVRGHALVWTSHWWEGKNWMGSLDYDNLKRLLVERAELVLSARPNAFDMIDFNEPLQCNPYNLTFDQHFELVKAVYQVVRRLSPRTRVMLNFYNEWQENYGYRTNDNPTMIRWRADYGIPEAPENEYCCTIQQFLDRCLAEGVEIDVLGLQFHDYPYDLFNTMELLQFWHNRYGLPIHLTELSTPSGMELTPIRMGKRPVTIPLYWHKPWDQQVQAQWYRDFASLCYSTDFVESFVVWSLSDAPTQWATYIEGHPNEKFRLQAFSYDGLLDVDNNPKQAYHQLCELKEKWRLPDAARWPDREA